MEITAWILFFAGISLFAAWVLRWGGAEWMAGWKSTFFIDAFLAPGWNADRIKLFVLIYWIGHCIWFVVGLFYPELRLSA